MTLFSPKHPQPKRLTTAPIAKPREIPASSVNADFVRMLLENRRLTERDLEVIEYFSTVSLLTSSMLKRLAWPDRSWSNLLRRLRQLYDIHILNREVMIEPGRWVGGGITYSIGKAALLLLNERVHRSAVPVVNQQTILHDLHVGEFFVQLMEEIRSFDSEAQYGLTFNWDNSVNARIYVDGDKSGVSQKEDKRPAHLRKDILVEPDAAFELIGPGKRMKFQFEMDMGTENSSAFIKKVSRYHSAFLRVRPKMIGEQDMGLVLVVTTSPHRARNLAEAVASELPVRVGNRAADAWLFTSMADISPNGIFHGAEFLRVTPKKVEPGKLGLDLGLPKDMIREGVKRRKATKQKHAEEARERSNKQKEARKRYREKTAVEKRGQPASSPGQSLFKKAGVSSTKDRITPVAIKPETEKPSAERYLCAYIKTNSKRCEEWTSEPPYCPAHGALVYGVILAKTSLDKDQLQSWYNTRSATARAKLRQLSLEGTGSVGWDLV